MIGYYKNTIIKLLTEIHENTKKPFENPSVWRKVQEKLIIQNINAENKIRKIKEEKKDLNIKRKNPMTQLSKEESLVIKNRLKSLDFLIEEYRFLIKIYKDIGDAVAFTFIHKLDIKPQNFKESAGFITQKIGFKKEKRFFKQIFDKGYIAILNDLTSTLRYCDIMIITKEGYFPIEVKTSNNKNPRVNRQQANADKLFSYLSEDFTEGLYDVNYPMHRVASSKEKNYIKEFNDLLKVSKQEGYAYKLMERGVLYMIMHTDQFENIDLKSIFKSKKLNTPTYFFVNQMKFLEAGYYPFSLSISNPEDYFDFVQGNFVVSIFIDFDILQKLSKKYNFIFEQTGDENFPIEFLSIENTDLTRIRMSNHIFYRIISEFVSLKWLVKDTLTKFYIEISKQKI